VIGSTGRALGHAVRMSARPVANTLSCRRRIRGTAHTVVSREAVLRRVSFDIRGTGHTVEIAPQARLSNLEIVIEGENHTLFIGSHVRIHRGAFHFYDSGCTIRIGERTTIYDASFGATEGGLISVGADCLLSTDIDIRNGDSHSIMELATGRRLNAAADVIIGHHVWLGVRTMVLKGSRIGDNTVVGAGSIVTGEIPGHCVATGVPARSIMDGTTWERERI
jgi:acetyltransferase-like isoleucine patch superfamily enzyme